MTGLLKDLLQDRADTLDAPTLDLAEITRAGERQIRRRRATAVVGVVAASVVAALAGAALLPDRGQPVQAAETVQAADGAPASALPLGWVTGRTLHVLGEEPVELSAVVRAWVWVGDGLAYTDETGQVHLWQDGQDEIIGTTAKAGREGTELVADGTRVAWVEPNDALTSYDTTSGGLTNTPLKSDPSAPGVTALDGAKVYAVDATGVLVWDAGTGVVEVIDPHNRSFVIDAESGVIIHQASSEDHSVLSRDGTTLRLPTTSSAVLSPDARVVSIENDEEDNGQILDAVTGAEKAFDHDYWWALGYQWLDDTSLAVLAFDGAQGEIVGHARVMTCDGFTGECDTSGQQLPGGWGDFQLPIGIHFEG